MDPAARAAALDDLAATLVRGSSPEPGGQRRRARADPRACRSRGSAPRRGRPGTSSLRSSPSGCSGSAARAAPARPRGRRGHGQRRGPYVGQAQRAPGGDRRRVSLRPSRCATPAPRGGAVCSTGLVGRRRPGLRVPTAYNYLAPLASERTEARL